MVRQAEGTLSSKGRSVRLEPRVMDVLVYLAVHRDRVVPKEELIEEIWGSAFVEEGALSQAIHSLRKVLGDDARQPRYIQTFPKRGYRLIAPLIPEAVSDDEPVGEPPRQPEPRGAPAGCWWRVLLPLCIAGFISIAIWLLFLRRGSEPPKKEGEIRLVVLPFETLGKPEDAFFADGLTDEITKDLASLRSFQVISRTSAMSYRGTRKTLPEIGRELGVDYVLEGTVLWGGREGQKPRVRINPQLIRVADDAHIWASAFEREVGDIFEVQSEISRQVIQVLGVTLIPGDLQKLRAQPTTRVDAYQAYLRGLKFKHEPFYSEEDLRKAVPMFERAVKLDPGFAAAWAELSQAQSYLAFNADPSPAQVERARQAMEKGAALAPDLPEVRLAQVYFSYRCLGDFDTANRQVNAAAQLFPNDSEVLQALGLVERRRGHLREAISHFEHAFLLDPNDVRLVWSIAETYRALREYEQADHYFAKVISLAPDESVFWEERALNRLAWSGRLEAAREVIREAPMPRNPSLLSVNFQLDLFERQFGSAFSRLSPEALRQLPPQAQSRLVTLAAIARERAGDHRGALAAAAENRVSLEARMALFPREPFYRGYWAVALAQLGNEAEALAQAERAAQERRNDLFTGPRMIEIQAMVDTILGRHREATDRLARLLATPYQGAISPVELRFSPVWDPLRDDPEFQKLLRRFSR